MVKKIGDYSIMPTQSQKDANKKYESEKVESIRFRVPKGKRAKIQECASKNGESVNEMLNRLTDEEIRRLGIK